MQTFADVSAGVRSSSARAYLYRLEDRPNLYVIKNAYATKVLINKEKVAYGVEFILDGKRTMTAYATKEVIVSAGAIKTPPLLMRSGVGPRSLLERNDIPCKSDLAVGENLINHVYMRFQFTYNVSPTPLSPLFLLDSLYQYATTKSGPFGPFSLFTAFLDTNNDEDDYFTATTNGSPDIEVYYYTIPRGATSMVESVNTFSATEKLNEQMIAAIQDSDILVLNLSFLKPKSRGVIELKKVKGSESQDSIIYSNYLGEPEDRATVLKAVKRHMDLMKSPAFEQIGLKFLRPDLPECDQFKDELDYLACHIKWCSSDGTHPHGTCKMAPKTDPKAVVDERLRVYGVAGLRVIDMSV